MEDGSVPVRAVPPAHRPVRRLRLPSSGGSEPAKSKLSLRARSRSCDKVPISGGSAPVKAPQLRFNPTTRPLPSAVTPYQSPSGLALSQFVLLRQRSPPVELYSATSADRSLSTLPVTGKQVSPS